MSTQPVEGCQSKENWGSRIGVVLAVAGSAVGLGNFLRFPGQAVNNGGGAFMIPYIISFLLVGIPIAWCEWTIGRLGGRYGQNNAPGIMFAIWRRSPAKLLGALALLVPVVIYMYYILLEAWCLDYAVHFVTGRFDDVFAGATRGVSGHAAQAKAVVAATSNFFVSNCGLNEHGSLLSGGRMIWMVLFSFLVNFVIIYRGVTKGIESFCKWAMPLLILCAIVILVRVLTLPNINAGLGFMWNPDWSSLANAKVWLAAAGQIFFSLSVGFGLILVYASYLRENDDVVLTSLSASSTNEFCEVILGGMIVVPAAFLFLGATAAKGGTFNLGFITVPAIMHFMPLGRLFGAMWFGLLFLAAVTSSLSMLQPAIAFLEDGFGLRRRASVAVLGVLTAIGAAFTMYFSKGALAIDQTDFWCNLFMIVAATGMVLMFGWVIGAQRGVEEMNRGADFRVPRFMPVLLRYVTPAFLIVILVAWTYQNAPNRIDQMNPDKQARIAARKVYARVVEQHFASRDSGEASLKDQAATLKKETATLLGPKDDSAIDPAGLPAWLADAQVSSDQGATVPVRELAARAAAAARSDANIARYVFLGIVVFLILLYVLADIACRTRIGRAIRRVEEEGISWEAAK